MMNYAAAFGYLQGRIEGLAIECKYPIGTIDPKELAERLEAAVREATEMGKNYDNDHDEYGNRK